MASQLSAVQSRPVLNRLSTPIHRVKQAASQRQVARAGMDVVLNAKGGEKNHDLSPGFAGALFAAAKYSSLDVNVELLKNCFAVAILLMAVSKTLLESDPFGGVSAFTGPVALAAEVLNVLPFLPAAACAAGVTLCRRAGDLLKERAAFYVALTSLAVAAYFDCASIWFCCTYTFVQGVEVLKSIQADKLPVLPLVPLGVAAYAAFDYFANGTDHTKLITICLILGELAWSVAGGLRSFIKE